MGPEREAVRKHRIGPGRVLLVLAVACIATSGCQTTRSFGDGCPGVYSGVRYFNHQIDTMPWDGKIFFAIDFPFSAILDTLLLPFTAFSDPVRPVEGWVPGCGWVKR